MRYYGHRLETGRLHTVLEVLSLVISSTPRSSRGRIAPVSYASSLCLRGFVRLGPSIRNLEYQGL